MRISARVFASALALAAAGCAGAAGSRPPLEQVAYRPAVTEGVAPAVFTTPQNGLPVVQAAQALGPSAAATTANVGQATAVNPVAILEPTAPSAKSRQWWQLSSPFVPSNNRNWSADQRVLPEASVDGRRLTVRHIRNCHYRTVTDFDVRYYDRTFDLETITSVDFIVVPFNDLPGIAHTMLSFGFANGDHLGVSVEIRKEDGEQYSPVRGFFNQYELMYVFADERDLILKNTNQWLCEVYLYRTVATPDQARRLLLDVVQRSDKLAKRPEFYNTVSNNCTTNIRDHINHCFPDRVPYDYRVLLPGYSDRLAYDLGLLKTDESFEQTRIKARVNYQAYLNRESTDFSQAIRR